MYTRDNYKAEILKFIEEEGYVAKNVSRKTSSIFREHENNLERNLYTRLFDIFAMDEDPEFEMNEVEFRTFITQM
jgi:hypothetical protein